MGKIVFSVIIPYKDRFDFVKSAIQSVNNQNFNQDKIEIIAVDDKGGDRKTEKRLKKIFKNVIFIENKDREGPGGKRNTGLQRSKGRFVIFLDSDDQLNKDFMKKAYQIFKNDASVGATLCLSQRLFEKKFPMLEKAKRTILATIWDLAILASYLFNKGFLFPSAFYLTQVSHMSFRKPIIGSIRFNYDYRTGGEDWDFVFRVSQVSKIKIIVKRMLIFRYSQISSTYTQENIVKKWASYGLLTSRLPKTIKKTIYFKLFQMYIRFFKN